MTLVLIRPLRTGATDLAPPRLGMREWTAMSAAGSVRPLVGGERTVLLRGRWFLLSCRRAIVPIIEPEFMRLTRDGCGQGR